MRRPLRLFLRVCLVALLVLAALMGAAYWFLQRDPAGLEGDGLRLSAAYLTVRPDIFALLRGAFSPWSVTLVRPRLDARLSGPLGTPEQLAGRLRALFAGRGDSAPAPLGFLETTCRLEVTQGDARLTDPDGASLRLHGFQCRLKGAPSGGISGWLRFSSLSYATRAGTAARLEHFRLEGESDLTDPLTATPDLRLGATFRGRAWPDAGRLTLTFQGQPGGWNGTFALAADLALGDMAGETVPLRVAGTAAMARGSREVNLRAVMLALGADSGRLDGTLRLPGGTQGPALDGRLLLHRASLTQWLGFARNLAPGLQLALVNITEGSIDFHLDGTGLDAPRISALCTGARFTGSGGVPSWKTPVVTLDLSAKSVDLGLAIPESVGKPPESVHFFHPPLTPLPGEPLKPGETGIGYDIRLNADTVRYGPLTITAAKTRIHPGKLDKNGLEDVLIDAEARLYGGSFRGQCILGGSAVLPYAITAQVRGVNGAPLARDMPVLPFRSGRFRADVSIQSRSRQLDVFLDRLRGSLDVRGEQGALAGGPAPGGVKFSQLGLELALRSGVWRDKRLGLDGVWDMRLESPDLDGSATLDGRLWFGASDAGAGMEFQKTPASGSLRLGPDLSGLPHGLRATWSAALGCQSARKRLTANGLRLAALGAGISGDLTLNGRAPSVQGAIDARSADLAHTLELLGLGRPRLPPALRSLSLTAELSLRPEELRTPLTWRAWWTPATPPQKRQAARQRGKCPSCANLTPGANCACANSAAGVSACGTWSCPRPSRGAGSRSGRARGAFTGRRSTAGAPWISARPWPLIPAFRSRPSTLAPPRGTENSTRRSPARPPLKRAYAPGTSARDACPPPWTATGVSASTTAPISHAPRTANSRANPRASISPPHRGPSGGAWRTAAISASRDRRSQPPAAAASILSARSWTAISPST